MPDVTALDMAAPQVKVGPALSATSDMPEVGAEAPAVSEAVTAKVVEDKNSTVETKTGNESVTPETKVAEDAAATKLADETPPWMKAEITKQRNKARDAEAAQKAAELRADQLTVNLTKSLESLDALTKAQAAQISKDAETKDPRPARETFDTPDAYDSALIDWAGRRAALVATVEAQKVAEAKTADEKAAAAKVESERQNQEVLDAYALRRDKFIEEHPDFEDVVEKQYPDDRSKELQISVPMAHVLLNDEDGPAIAYYLGQNPDEAVRISKLPPVRVAAELGRIAARLATKPAVVTKPAPIKPLKTGSETAIRKSANEESMAEYGDRRNRELLVEKRSRMGLAN